MPLRFVVIFPLRWRGQPEDAVLHAEASAWKPNTALWRRLDSPPDWLTDDTGFDHLAPTVRALLGLAEGEFRMTWLAPDATLAGRLTGKLHPIDGPPVAFDALSLVACPLGSGFLLLSGQSASVAAADQVELVFRLRAAELDRRHPGWRIEKPPPESARDARAAAAASFGALAPALMGQPIYLGELVDWLVGGFAERSRRDGIVHVAASLPEAPEPTALERDAWHLGRGYSSAYLAPVGAPVLYPRGNRVLSLSRDGAAALSWAVGAAGDDFELGEFPRRFTTAWLALHLLVLTERDTLAGLSSQLQERVGALSTTRDHAAHRAARDGLGLLVEQMIRYSAAISTEDCGGLSDHVEFYDELRRIHGIHAQRAELRAEVAEVFGLVQARLHEAEAEARERTEAIERLDARARELEREHDARFQGLVGRIGVPALCFSVVSGLLGMNVDLFGPSFFLVLVATVLVSAVVYQVVGRWAAPPEAARVALDEVRDKLAQLRR